MLDALAQCEGSAAAAADLRNEALDNRRLADPRLAGDEHEPSASSKCLLTQASEIRQLALAPGRSHGEVSRGLVSLGDRPGRGRVGPGELERGILLQHPPLEFTQTRRRIDS